MDEYSVSASEADVRATRTAVVSVTTVAIATIDEREPVVVADTDTFRDLVNRTLDVVDELADAIAVGIGLRAQ